jgi:chemosensory pili system protein ChpA (sensor histidine kinase/response regulator)
LDLGRAETLRVNMNNVESVVSLTGELTIALSAFDQDMEGMGNLIAEIDRARQRLKQTAHDLERGYELKAIRHLGSVPPAVNHADAAAGETRTTFADFDLLELDRYSELNLIIRSLSETAVDVSTISQQLSNVYSGFDAYLNRLRVLVSDLHQQSIRMRMTPMSTIVNRLRRTLRETAAQLGKQIQLSVHGEHIELDKRVWEKLADPLMHLLRNAVDHGIESADRRRAAGKPETALVRIDATYQGNHVVIRVTDDGAGLDYESIRHAAVSASNVSDAQSMSEAELADMIFQNGFSTRKTISHVSGRGVGLDVVRANILALKGSVRIETSAPGVGTTFRISLPLTMAVMQALLFQAGGQTYATALYDIKEIVRVDPNKIDTQAPRTVTIDGRRMPFYTLSDALAGEAAPSSIDDGGQWPLVLVIEKDSWQGAVSIDRLLSQREIVIKSLGPHLRRVIGVAGATVLGDGKVLPILNLEELLNNEPARQAPIGPSIVAEQMQQLEIMVVDDSVSVRTVVSRLMERQGWQVRTAKDGVEAMGLLHDHRPDVIILDVEMPRMNGYEFMSSMRAQPDCRDTPVIMLTSRGSKKHRDKAQALGVSGFMTKPYDDEAFVGLVQQLSGQPAA